MPHITDAQRVVEACHDALHAAIRAVRADAEQQPEADDQALLAYEACLAAGEVAWNVYASRRDASLATARKHQPESSNTTAGAAEA